MELSSFLEEWDNYYLNLVKDIELFDPEKTKNWNKKQVEHFVRTFYHVRGHFHEFLFFLANFAPDNEGKEMVLKNITDEIGLNHISHEKLYHIFAEQLGVEILHSEMIEEKTNLTFIKEFNKGYINALSDVSWSDKVSAFAALERLDNVDYNNTKLIAESLGVTGTGLTFFNVHMNSKHFDHVLEDCFREAWEEDSKSCKNNFYFVADYQSKMWQQLSDEIFYNCYSNH